MPKRDDAPQFDSRGLVLGWCLWLIGAWLLLLLSIGWSPLAYRWMIFASMIGLMGMWPAARLSQDHRGPGARTVIFVDWLCMMLVFQAVLWPMQIVAKWSVEQTLVVNTAVGAWALLTGLIIAWGRSFGSGKIRTYAMLGCVGLLIAEPLLLGVAAFAQGHNWSQLPNLRLSPVQTIWELTSAPALYTRRPWADYTVAIGAAALVGWCVLAVSVPRRSAAPEHAVPDATPTPPASTTKARAASFPIAERPEHLG